MNPESASRLTDQIIQRAPLRERLGIIAALAAISGLAWLYLIGMPMPMGAMASPVMAPMAPTTAGAGLTFLMWAVMMVAMMLPSASPMILTYARIARGRPSPTSAIVAFAAAYLVVWAIFSLFATVCQIALQNASLLSGPSRLRPIFGAVLLAAAGLYQLTPLKRVCLAHCRSPIGFLMSEWRSGVAGAFTMGARHGIYCVGCCWMLMALLFVFGVMNLLWVAALGALVLLEKLAPRGRLMAGASGVLMLVGALALAVHG